MKIKNILFAISFAIVLAAGLPAWGDSPSDLLEQGVYSEETKGDLDSAMQIYEKVIAQAKTDQALAAQAQYHLGVCYYKKHDYANANSTFATLIQEYPAQKEIIALARKYLAGVNALLPAPWGDGEDLRLDIKLAGGTKIGIMDYAITSAVSTNGNKIWKISSHTAAGSLQAASHVEVEADTFSPIHSFWRYTLIGTVDAVYYPDHVDLKKAGSDEIKKINFDQPVIDNEEAGEWMRRLPLTNGYTITEEIFSSLGSRVVPVALSVTGPENVTVPAGTFGCYKVELDLGQTFWYSSDANRYPVKFEGGGAIGELASITHHAAGEKAAYSDASIGISMTAPAGWLFYNENTETNAFTIVGIVDPNAYAESHLAFRSLASLKATQTNSLRSYATHLLEEEGKAKKDFKLRADSWKDATVAGQPALSFVSDYTENEKPKITYTVCSFLGTNAVCFMTSGSAQDLETLRPQWNSVIDSFQSQ